MAKGETFLKILIYWGYAVAAILFVMLFYDSFRAVWLWLHTKWEELFWD